MKPETFTSWLAAALVAVLPAIVAADSGGVLPWTQWALGCMVALILLLTIPAFLSASRITVIRAFSVAVCLLLFAFLAIFQIIPLTPSLLNTIAPGSAESYTNSVEIIQMVAADPLANETSVSHPVSVATWLTKETASLMAVLAAFAVVSAQLFVTRPRIALLLLALGFAGAIQAGFGIVQMIADPTATVWGIKSFYGGAPFGSFVCRNNAAVMLNLGLAAGLGLIAWRLAAITGAALNGDQFPASELLDVIFDRMAMIGISCALMCVAGLLACGSRGGVVGAVAGLLLAFGLVQSIHKGRGLVPTLLAIGLMAAILLVKFELPASSLDRLRMTPEQVLTDAGIQDGRLEHWQDAWHAGVAQPLFGWGAGAYRYAYLPFQYLGSGVWFVNADNVWLEWFVETGIIGSILALGLLFYIIRALHMLNTSPDPIDHGIATAGWYALGAVGISQVFDFGIRIPANSLAIVLLASAIVARSTIVEYFDSATNVEPQIRKPTRPMALALTGPAAVCGLFICCGLALLPAIRFLDAEARADHVRRLAYHLPRGPQFNPDVASDLGRSLTSHLLAHPDDTASHLELSKLIVDAARFKAAKSAALDSSVPDWVANYRTLSPSVLRTIWYQSSATNQSPLFPIQAALSSTPVSIEKAEASTTKAETELARQRLELGTQLNVARIHAGTAVLTCPLSDEAYSTLASLDFAGGSQPQTERLITEIVSLRRRNAQSMLYAGILAAEANLWDLAARSWGTAIQNEPEITAAVLTNIHKNSPISISEILPENVVAISIAAQHELAKPFPNKVLLERAAESLGRLLPDDRVKRVACLRLLAQIYTKRQQAEKAAETMALVVALVPGDLDSRYQYALALRKAGNLNEARQQARAGRKIDPKDARFEQLINAMSEISFDP